MTLTVRLSQTKTAVIRIQLWFLVLVVLLIGHQVSFAQSQPGAGTRSNYTIYGDLTIDESQASGAVPLIFDVILYTRGGEVFARQRIGNNGRYRFLNVFNGDYYVAIELESVEITRASILITPQYPSDIRKDFNLQWRAIASRRASGVVAVTDLYERSARNKSLYEKSQHEIEKKNYSQAIALLREIVETDPKDFVSWSDLGMLYFIDKNFDDAEKSYVSATVAKPSYFPATLSLGRVQLAKRSYESAIQSLESALKLDPKSAAANYFLGEAQLQMKKGSKAVVFFNEALKLDPIGMAEAHLRLAALYNGAGYKDRAAAEYEHFLKKQPNYPDRKKLEQYIATNKPKEAEKP
jgi:tetratricopeptide (TPR) repeat protein